jgi:hypothetical protein
MKFIILIILLSSQAHAEWIVDFSRRQKDLVNLEKTISNTQEDNKTFFETVLERQSPVQDLVILHTENGFVPRTVSLKKDQRYRVNVVNVNKKKENVSFMLDSFSEHHGIYFGDHVSFVIEPRKEGMFQFQCPETAAKGQFAISVSEAPIESPIENVKMRTPSSQ